MSLEKEYYGWIGDQSKSITYFPKGDVLEGTDTSEVEWFGVGPDRTEHFSYLLGVCFPERDWNSLIAPAVDQFD